jgi:hypothetical protein
MGWNKSPPASVELKVHRHTVPPGDDRSPLCEYRSHWRVALMPINVGAPAAALMMDALGLLLRGLDPGAEHPK